MIPARHVLLLLKHNHKWLVTKHTVREMEFSGGQAEEGETIEAAVKREAYEETGVVIEHIKLFAKYVVYSEERFCKAVFTADVQFIYVDGSTYGIDGGT